jgi:hypothetical protein
MPLDGASPGIVKTDKEPAELRRFENELGKPVEQWARKEWEKLARELESAQSRALLSKLSFGLTSVSQPFSNERLKE